MAINVLVVTLWKVAKLNADLRRDITFYAPLTDSLDYIGVEPVTYTRAGSKTVIWRDGASHTVGADVPRFAYVAGVPQGIFLEDVNDTLTFAPGNNLDNGNTLVWFEDGDPKSTPTNGNPFSASGTWTGNLGVHVKHITKANRVLTNSEISSIQIAFEDVAQALPGAPPPSASPGTFVLEIPAGVRNGSNTVFTLSSNPNLNSLLIVCHGGLTLYRVASSPDQLQFTAGGTGNRTITMGLAPNSTDDFTALYVTA